MNERGRSDHADLDGIWADVLKDSIELCCQEFRRGLLHHADALRVLRRQGRDGAHAVDAVGKHRLEICLNPCATARITARDCQHLAYHFHKEYPLPVSIIYINTSILQRRPLPVKEISRFHPNFIGSAMNCSDFSPGPCIFLRIR